MGLVVFIAGLLVGSFLNVCIYRIPREESIVFPGSHCPSCNTNLKAVELIPVFSWLWLGGKCRTCQSRINGRYPFVEFLTSIILLLVYMEVGIGFRFLLLSIISLLLLVITFIDLDHQIIPDGLTLLIAATGLVNLLYGYVGGDGISILNAATGLLLGGGFFLLIAVASKGGMGGGDIKLMAALGIWFGWQGILLVMFLAFIIGGIYAVGLLVLRGKGRKDMVPFGPFIALGGFLSALYGQDILLWYLTRFL
ncbi:MAG: prepilin peptidase [Tindallia sp. MSAO_Bac2]|nr:MAG: prepilin peptidase [Tindallia sp. MSAO_Bac2]